jgi:hypothetical protein
MFFFSPAPTELSFFSASFYHPSLLFSMLGVARIEGRAGATFTYRFFRLLSHNTALPETNVKDYARLRDNLVGHLNLPSLVPATTHISKRA